MDLPHLGTAPGTAGVMSLTPEQARELVEKVRVLEAGLEAQNAQIQELVILLAQNRNDGQTLINELTAKFNSQETSIEEMRQVQLRILTHQALASGGGKGSGVDTRVLGKPFNYDGSASGWKDWSFTFEAYCGAISEELLGMVRAWSLKIDGGLLESLTADERRWSLQLGYMLTLLLKGEALKKQQNLLEPRHGHCPAPDEVQRSWGIRVRLLREESEGV